MRRTNVRYAHVRKVSQSIKIAVSILKFLLSENESVLQHACAHGLDTYCYCYHGYYHQEMFQQMPNMINHSLIALSLINIISFTFFH